MTDSLIEVEEEEREEEKDGEGERGKEGEEETLAKRQPEHHYNGCRERPPIMGARLKGVGGESQQWTRIVATLGHKGSAQTDRGDRGRDGPLTVVNCLGTWRSSIGGSAKSCVHCTLYSRAHNLNFLHEFFSARSACLLGFNVVKDRCQ